MTSYSPFDYSSTDPTNGAAGRQLSETIAKSAFSFPKVRSVCELGRVNVYRASLVIGHGLLALGVDASETGLTIASKTCGKSDKFLCQAIDANLPLNVQERSIC